MAFEFANVTADLNRDHITYSAATPVAGLGTCSIVARLAGDSDCPSYANAVTVTSPSNANDVALLREATGNNMAAAFRGSGSNSARVHFPFAFDGAMRSVVVTFDGSASPKIKAYVDGSGKTVTVAVPHGNSTIGSGHTATSVGGAFNARFNGRIAEAAIYNRVITPDEAAMHAAGYSCLHFQRGLIFYAPLIRDAQDIAGGLTPTITGTTIIDHPRIYA